MNGSLKLLHSDIKSGPVCSQLLLVCSLICFMGQLPIQCPQMRPTLQDKNGKGSALRTNMHSLLNYHILILRILSFIMKVFPQLNFLFMAL